ncbi:rhodanese-like domain-containing protein [Catenovulum sp. 2E275]|uniref:rhodanese-like domain-containing protein n=1 Tax=Catenovulum sp. 2E275 TaxID=2980497 RepID=UPI0021D2C1FB|nr:rhodanese-like domain-containing protein [Catenovulum sp. 2E275]MCU4674575.1 rhodanese-like domain-containing protein [Catenovulum sp. 2E275]
MLLTSQAYVEQTKKQIQVISVAELVTRQSQFFVVDIREANEVALGKIPGAIAISRGVLEMKITAELEKHQQNIQNQCELSAQPIVLYCQSGARSAFAANSLTNMGFSCVYSLDGGIKAWQVQNLPMQKV